MFIIGITRILNYQNTMNIEKKRTKKQELGFFIFAMAKKKQVLFPQIMSD